VRDGTDGNSQDQLAGLTAASRRQYPQQKGGAEPQQQPARLHRPPRLRHRAAACRVSAYRVSATYRAATYRAATYRAATYRGSFRSSRRHRALPGLRGPPGRPCFRSGPCRPIVAAAPAGGGGRCYSLRLVASGQPATSVAWRIGAPT
jgi:hypothetical protein